MCQTKFVWNIIKNSNTESYLSTKLAELKDHPLVGEVQSEGVILRATRDVMVMSPPLIITRKEIDIMIDRARKALDATAKDIGVS